MVQYPLFESATTTFHLIVAVPRVQRNQVRVGRQKEKPDPYIYGDSAVTDMKAIISWDT